MKLLESEKSIFDFDCDKKHSADYTFDDITVEINGTKLTDNPDDAHVYCSSYFDFNVNVDSLTEQDAETENDITLSLTYVDTGEEAFSESYPTMPSPQPSADCTTTAAASILWPSPFFPAPRIWCMPCL